MYSPDALADLLRRHGRKVTAQRLSLYQAIQTYGQHITAEEVFERVRLALPTISLTTVYAALHEYCELGLVRRVELGDGSTRFDPNMAPHAHLVCRQCGRTDDLPATDYVLGLPAALARGYTELVHELVFAGVCPACRAAQVEPSPEHGALNAAPESR